MPRPNIRRELTTGETVGSTVDRAASEKDLGIDTNPLWGGEYRGNTAPGRQGIQDQTKRLPDTHRSIPGITPLQVGRMGSCPYRDGVEYPTIDEKPRDPQQGQTSVYPPWRM